MVSVFNYQSLPPFLRAYIDKLPKRGWAAVQKWAEHLNVQPSYISQVLAGTKTFSIDQALSLTSVLGLTGLELDYFVLLVEKEKAGGHLAKKYFDEKLHLKRQESLNLAKRIPRDKKLDDEQKAIFYSSWIYSGVRMFCTLGKGKTLDEIEKKFNLSRIECVEILNFLVSVDLLKKEGARYVMGAQKTHLERQSPHIRLHWLNWHLKAMSRFDQIQDDEMIYSAPFSISEKDFEALRQELTDFVKGFVARVQETKPERVAYLNIDLLKLIE